MFRVKRIPIPCISQPNLCSSFCNVTNYHLHITQFLSNQSLDPHTISKSHSYILTTGNSTNIFLSAKLISLYSLFQNLKSSTKVFNSVPYKDTFLWNSIIKAHFSNGLYPGTLYFFKLMLLSHTPPNGFTIPMIATACAELLLFNLGKSIHGLSLHFGLFACNLASGSSMVYMYSKFGIMDDARCMFDEIPIKDVISWTALVIGYVQNGNNEKGLDCFYEMHNSGGGDFVRPNFRTFEGGFQACSNLGNILEGRCLHGLGVKSGNGCFQAVQSSILSMYAKCRTHEDARLSFNEVLDKDIISWTLIIGVYAGLGSMNECITMFSEMQLAQICPDGIVISCLLMGFGNSLRVYEGKCFHGIIIRKNYILNGMVHNALLSMYCKFGLVAPMEKLFHGVHELDEISWNIMVLGYNKIGWEMKCLEIFIKMQLFCVECDFNCLVSVISSCSKLGAIRLGRSIHSKVIKSSKNENISVVNSLTDMYGNYGDLVTASKIFSLAQRDVVTWNTMISSYIHNGHFFEALELFNKMVLSDIKPNVTTLVIILSACSHLASLEHGERIHKYIKNESSGLSQSLSLTTSIVDMYAKCGEIIKARETFDSMNERDVICWNVMISGYAINGDAKSALQVFGDMEKSTVLPNGLTFLALLSACTHAGLVEEGKWVFSIMRKFSVGSTLKHYACMIDLLGRFGKLHEAEEMVISMPIAPDGYIWGALLSACKVHGDIEMGIQIAKRAIESDPDNDGYYIMISNMYSSCGRWAEADQIREVMKERRVGKTVGWSLG